ncbi:MAG TPA: NBR1-Ig-like domain-containing protein [Anaerolineaceae bacterium]|nr:NBR1-Ig-like domain-containing protein [Anaerolineaceae bacterium]
MNKKIRKITLLILMVFTFSIVLGACKPAEPVEPTLDANVIFTQAAETVAAQLTRTALSQPTATNTPTPTATQTATKPVPTATQSDANLIPTSASPGSDDTTPNPNKMVFVADVTIPDGQIIPAGSKFVKTWRIRNTGTTTWSPNYNVRLWAGERLGAPASFLLGQEVAPNTEVDISIEFTAPLQNGEYFSHWILSDELLANFGNTFYVKFIVGVPASPTITEPAPTNTPEPEPTS